jgi:hypothetical protein
VGSKRQVAEQEARRGRLSWKAGTLGCHALYVTIDVNACQLKGSPKKEVALQALIPRGGARPPVFHACFTSRATSPGHVIYFRALGSPARHYAGRPDDSRGAQGRVSILHSLGEPSISNI